MAGRAAAGKPALIQGTVNLLFFRGASLSTEISASDAIAYYANGWYPSGCPEVTDGRISWDNPEVRCVIDIRGRTWKRYYQSARRKARKGGFELGWDRAFTDVIAACAHGRRPGEPTWITEEMASLYHRLHSAGAAHSGEAWLDGRLVGGVVFLRLGGWFSVETAFHIVSDAGNAAMAAMADQVIGHGCVLFDFQRDLSEFARRLGGVQISRDAYLTLLTAAIDPTTAPESASTVRTET
jgi:leucyl/phenylalanyl-tRNA---protein transferase